MSDFVLANGYLYTLPPYNYEYKSGGGVTSDSWLDILDPVSLTKIGSYQLPQEYPALDVVVAGYHTYIYWTRPCMSGCTDNGWLTVDVADPTEPTLIDTSYHPERVQGVTVRGKAVYIASGVAGLHILDTSDPDNPTDVDGFSEPGFAYDVAVADGYIYLANGSGGLHILRYPGAK